MGFGDVKLSFLLGLGLGSIRLAYVPIGFFLAFFLGAVVGMVLIALGKASRKSKLPFGPYLAIGTVATFYLGSPLASLWLHR